MKINEVIRKYRKEKQLTQEEMARRLGVTAPAVNKWESGRGIFGHDAGAGNQSKCIESSSLCEAGKNAGVLSAF